MNNSSETRDSILWRIAKKRAAFRKNLFSYIVFSGFLTCLWWFTGAAYFWPAWSILGWGVGLAYQYGAAFHHNQFVSTETEYRKLVEEHDNRHF